MSTEKFYKLFDEIITFNRNHGWAPTPADLAKSIVIEAAELLELFQWDETDSLNSEGSVRTLKKNKEEIAMETADVLWYILSFCKKCEIDPLEALKMKYIHNERKYPTEKFNGKHNEEFYRERKRMYRGNN